MFNLKILILLTTAAAACADQLEIPEYLTNAKDISERPEVKKTLEKIYSNTQVESHAGDQEKVPFIIGGSIAKGGEFPYQVLIFTIASANEVYMCGGSLINSTWVVTAAHCVFDPYQELMLFFGMVNISVASASRTVLKKDVVVHQNYNPKNFQNDIAMIKINDMSSSLYGPNIGLLTLPRNYTSFTFTSTVAVASGFGRTSDLNYNTSNFLKYVNLVVIPNDICEAIYSKDNVRPTNLCTSTSSIAATCNGDSGGPLVSIESKVLIGIVSFGAKDGCEIGYPAGFTRVTSYLNWMDKVMNGSLMSYAVNVLLLAVAQLLLFYVKF